MDVSKILKGYTNRVSTISSYYFLVSIFINRNKFKEFTNEEFFNMTMQLLCYIFEKSLKRENCIKDDIIYFIEELNLVVYKKDIDKDYINELVSYLINGLTNSGKPFGFNYFKFENDKQDIFYVKLIQDEVINTSDGMILSYSLTTEGYRLLLSTKEYDEIFQIQVNQMIAKLRIEKGDYAGAKNDIQDIIQILNIQQQNINNYLKAVKSDIYYIKKEKFIDLISNSIKVLTGEMDKYDELKKNIQQLIKDKEEFLSEDNFEQSSEENNNILKIQKQLILMRDLIDGINEAKKHASSLLNRIQDFRIEYDDILEKLLRSSTLSKFNFNEVFLNQIENDDLNLDSLTRLYKSLFKPKVENIFYIDTPYKEQKILSENEDFENIEIEDEWILIEDTRKQEIIDYNESYHFVVINEIVNYGLKHDNFTLKEFLNYNIKSHQENYIKITKNSGLLRDIILNLTTLKNISISKLKHDLTNATFSQSKEMQIERVFERILRENNKVEDLFGSMSISQLSEEISINTEIDLLDMTSVKLTTPNISFVFKK